MPLVWFSAGRSSGASVFLPFSHQLAIDTWLKEEVSELTWLTGVEWTSCWICWNYKQTVKQHVWVIGLIQDGRLPPTVQTMKPKRALLLRFGDLKPDVFALLLGALAHVVCGLTWAVDQPCWRMGRTCVYTCGVCCHGNQVCVKVNTWGGKQQQDDRQVRGRPTDRCEADRRTDKRTCLQRLCEAVYRLCVEDDGRRLCNVTSSCDRKRGQTKEMSWSSQQVLPVTSWPSPRPDAGTNQNTESAFCLRSVYWFIESSHSVSHLWDRCEGWSLTLLHLLISPVYTHTWTWWAVLGDMILFSYFVNLQYWSVLICPVIRQQYLWHQSGAEPEACWRRPADLSLQTNNRHTQGQSSCVGLYHR